MHRFNRTARTMTVRDILCHYLTTRLADCLYWSLSLKCACGISRQIQYRTTQRNKLQKFAGSRVNLLSHTETLLQFPLGNKYDSDLH
jgi:hypothetical protein